MKIGPLAPDSARLEENRLTVGDRTTPSTGAATTEPVVSTASVDRVSLTGSQKIFGQSAVLSFDARKVEEVRQMIAEGRFPVDAKRVAEQLLNESRDFLAPKASSRPS